MYKKKFKRLWALMLAVVMITAQASAVYADTSDTAEQDSLIIEETGNDGSGEGYVLSDSQSYRKQLLRDNDAIGSLKDMKEGVDYVSGKVIFLADSYEDALLIADKYGAVLTDFDPSCGLGSLKLPETMTVIEAAAASQGNNDMPPVSPDYISKIIEPDYTDDPAFMGQVMGSDSGFRMPAVTDYISWIKGEGTNPPLLASPDKYLLDTSDSDYQWQHEMVNSYGAWASTMGSKDIKVAIIDTGVSATHPDLAGKVTQIQVGNIPPAPADETQYHGSHCAGIVAATAGNGIGGAGIAPNVSILSYNVFGDQHSFQYSTLVTALSKAISQEPDIISMSLGGYGYSAEIQTMLNMAYKKGITVVVAMGNDGMSIKQYPAAMDHVIAVASVNKDGSLSTFSNYGSWCDIAAPGSHIMSTDTTGYRNISGTSMATPVVAGVAALYMSRFGNPGPDQMEKLLKKSAVKSSAKGIGAGIVNAYNMFASADISPSISILDPSGRDITGLKGNVPEGSTAVILASGSNSNDLIIYTDDGSTPSIKDGELSVGSVYSGPLSLDAYASGSAVTIKALTVSATGQISKPVSLKFTAPDKTKSSSTTVGTVTLDNTSLNILYKGGYTSTQQLSAATLKDSRGNDLSLNSCKHEWISSNTSVVKINENPDGNATLIAAGGGSAKVTLNILDGSKKSAVCNVTVVRLADTVKIDGQSSIAAGGSAAYKAIVEPKDAKSKNVTWSIAGEAPSGVSVDKGSGKVTVASSVKEGTVFTLLATVNDESETVGMLDITVRNKMNELIISAGTDPRASYDKKGKLSSVKLFSRNIPSLSGTNNEISLTALADGRSDRDDFIWSSSNTQIAEINGDNRSSAVTIRGLKAGNVKLTCQAADGSGKKSIITVNVINPASSVKIMPNDSGDIPFYLATGKSKQFRAALGSSYGKPSVNTVDWSFKVYGISTLATQTRNGLTYVNGYNDSDNKDITDNFKDAVSLSNKGKLSVNKKKWEAGMRMMGMDLYDNSQVLRIEVTATAADGTGLSDSVSCYVMSSNTKWKGNMRLMGSRYNSGEVTLRSDEYLGSLIVTTSSTAKMCPSYSGCIYSGGVFYYYVNATALGKKGSVTVKATLNDGSSRTRSIKFKLY